MEKKIVGIFVCILFFGACVFPSISGTTEKLAGIEYSKPNAIVLNTIIVPDDYSKIQDAINAANDYDTIFVRNGTYYENLKVDKPIILIGENKDTTVIDGSKIDMVVDIGYNANYVILTGFMIKNGTSTQPYVSGGIVISTSFCTIYGNVITDNINGIILRGDDNIISENIITNNAACIYIRSSFGNNISRNYISSNGYTGIELYDCQNNTISGNIITNNYYGIWAYIFAHKNTIIGNTITNNGEGIIFKDQSSQNSIICNNIKDNSVTGIKLQKDCNYNRIFCNNIFNNDKNVDFIDCYNKFSKNYWGKQRFFPKAIWGKQGAFPWLQFDWSPTQYPY